MVMVDEGFIIAFDDDADAWMPASSLLVPTVVDLVNDEPRLPFLPRYRLLSLCSRSLVDKSESLKLLLLSRLELLQLQLARPAPDFDWPR